jgi:hypothetical protein
MIEKEYFEALKIDEFWTILVYLSSVFDVDYYYWLFDL